MKKNTANKYRIIKAVYGAVIGLLFQLAFQLPQTVGTQMTLVFIVMLAYILPLIINVEYIKSHEITGVKPFIIGDAVFLLPESIVSCVAAEYVISAIIGSDSYYSGMGTLIFAGIALIVTACFWAVYAAVNKLYKEE